MYTQGGGFGFGASQPASSPFGGGFAASSPFGAASAPSFGGAPAFGAAAGFGAASSPSIFGNAQPAQSPFGATAASGNFTFGAQSSPSPFGASSQGAFGASPGFGAPASSAAFGFGSSTPAFGSSAPAFGAASSPAFGGGAAFGSGTGFGATAFGASSAAGAFGLSTPVAGGAPSGTRLQPYAKHQDKDQSSSTAGGASVVFYNTITAMPAYASKSVEELRWEDYQAGVKSGGAAAPAGFGAATAASSPFGTGTSTFGGVGAAASPFGAAPAGGGLFGASSTPSTFGGFGASPASSPFGAASTPMFGAGASSSGSLFGAPATTPAFGAASTPAFGAASAPAPFGASPSGFGGFGSTAPAATGAFGAVSAASPSLFGSTGSPFGVTAAASSPFGATPAFGAAPTAASSPFNAFGSTASKPSSTFSFAASSASTFGGASAGGLFGASSTPAFGAGASAFGTASAPSLFGAASSTSGLFGGAPAFASSTAFSFAASTGALFGGSAAAPAGGLFGQSTLVPTSAPAANMFGGAGLSLGAAPAAVTGTGPAPSPGGSPFGGFSTLPVAPTSAGMPGSLTGLSARAQLRPAAARPSPLLTLRSAGPTPRFGLGMEGSGKAASGPRSAGKNKTLGNSLVADGSPLPLLQSRDNPHRLFIKEPPPAVALQPASATSLSNAPRVVDPRSNGDASPARAGGLPGSDRSAGNVGGQAAAGQAVGNGAPFDGGYSASPSAAADEQRKEAAARAKAAAGAQAPHPSHLATDVERPALTPQADEVAGLGRLGHQGYSMDPSHERLQEMWLQNPSSLSHLEGFSISREGKGRLRWLEPVDLRGVQLEESVSIGQGEVTVYGGTAVKPPVGEGLNTRCEITLYGVYRKNKETGQYTPSKDPATIMAFERRLRRYCAQNDSRHVAYKPDGGVWVFEVDHFSRYAVPDDEDEEGDAAETAAGHEQAARVRPSLVAQIKGVPLASAEPSFACGADSTLQLAGQEGLKRSVAVRLQPQAPGRSMTVMLTPPSATPKIDVAGDLQPVALQHTLPATVGLQPAALSQLRSELLPVSGHVALGVTTTVKRHAGPSMHSWEQQGSTLEAAGAAGRCCNQPLSTGLAWTTEPTSTAPAFAEGSEAGGSSSTLPAFSLRAGWGPGGCLVRAAASSRSVIHVQQLTAPPATSTTPDLEALLELHLQHSKAAGEQDSVPQWTLDIDSKKLAGFVADQLSLAVSMGVRDSAAAQYARATWRLVQVLFENLEDPAATPDGMLTALRRRAHLSAWVQQMVHTQTMAAADGASAVPGAAGLLAGRQLAAYSAVAAQHDMRGAAVASAVAACGSDSAKDVRLQAEAGTPIVQSARSALLHLLGGEDSGPSSSLRLPSSLTWQLALGLKLWYATQPRSPLTSAVSKYCEAISSGQAVPASPPYAAYAADARVRDTQYELLLLAGTSPSKHKGHTTVLQSDGHTSQVLDACLAWQLGTVLSSLGVADDEQWRQAMAVVCVNFANQLELAGVPAHWPAFVLAHIMDAELRRAAVREFLSTRVAKWAKQGSVSGSFMTERLLLDARLLNAARMPWAAANVRSCLQAASATAAGWRETALHLFKVGCAPALQLSNMVSSDSMEQLQLVLEEVVYAAAGHNGQLMTPPYLPDCVMRALMARQKLAIARRDSSHFA